MAISIKYNLVNIIKIRPSEPNVQRISSGSI
jgi:hypothetical protein